MSQRFLQQKQKSEIKFRTRLFQKIFTAECDFDWLLLVIKNCHLSLTNLQSDGAVLVVTGCPAVDEDEPTFRWHRAEHLAQEDDETRESSPLVASNACLETRREKPACDTDQG
jgi:hypothetical protein